MLRDRLYNILNDNFCKDTTYLIAEYIINNLDRIGDISIYEVAEECHASVATVSRFCRRIGFADYSDFREACQIEQDRKGKMQATHAGNSMLMQKGMPGLEEELQGLNQQLLQSLQKLSLEKVHRLVADIRRYEYVYFIGQSNTFIMSGHLQTELLAWGKYCRSITEIPHEGFPVEKQKSLAVVFSMHGYLTKYSPSLVEFVREQFDTCWEISQVSQKGKLAHTLYFGKCGQITADYMAWIYVADLVVYEYRKLLGVT